MKEVKMPKTILLEKGKVFKNLKMIAEGNSIGPKHLSVEESILTMIKGKAILKMEGKEHQLNVGDAIIIPGGIEHYLEIIEDTEAIHTMSVVNKIKMLKE
ncbi:cupin domain-containing protein [Brumimicrobium glaciale]|uniref:Cupin domain-containing protein n=1 Tax=Brumimicrobium glaciale TaxID=200475 RepID=A0A4Q4KQY7_9FLAO|nr:cupin domain-containing protein [Brumimicrobium glaciale]RYM35455.1 cupin domain-containing protein [Brumimicrobium glaciale]